MSSPTPSGPRLVHVACIMDGNGRWAKRKHLPRTEGHTEGEENLARLVRIAVTRNVGWLTEVGSSTENWVRPRTEVRHILAAEVEKVLAPVARPLAVDTARKPHVVLVVGVHE